MKRASRDLRKQDDLEPDDVRAAAYSFTLKCISSAPPACEAAFIITRNLLSNDIIKLIISLCDMHAERVNVAFRSSKSTWRSLGTTL